jgi:hypothetical protein
MMTLCDALLSPSGTGPKSNDSGLNDSEAPFPSPRSRIVNDPILVELFDVVENTPLLVGEKEKKYWQKSPGGTPPAQF